jgi:hypothetical protein
MEAMSALTWSRSLQERVGVSKVHNTDHTVFSPPSPFGLAATNTSHCVLVKRLFFVVLSTFCIQVFLACWSIASPHVGHSAKTFR